MRSPLSWTTSATSTCPRAAVQIGEEERAAVDRACWAPGMLAQGPEVAAFESEFAGTSTGGRASRSTRAPAPCCSRCSRSGSGPATRWSSRRSASRRRRTRSRSPAHAGVRRHRARPLLPRPRGRRGGGHRADRRDHPGAPLRPSRADGPHRRRRREARARRRRGRRPGPPRRARRAPGRHLRRGRRLQLLPHQEHDRGRGRDGRLRRRGRRTHGAPAAQPGHGTPLRQRDRRLQHADDRPARRHRSGPARRAAAAGRSSAGATPRSSAASATCDGVVVPPTAPRRRASVAPVHRPRAAIATACAAGWPTRGVGTRRLLPDADPPAPGVRRSSSTCP